VIESHQVQRAMQHQDAQFIRKRVAVFFRLRRRSIDRDRDLAQLIRFACPVAQTVSLQSRESSRLFFGGATVRERAPALRRDRMERS
jgi:hypothetical protein